MSANMNHRISTKHPAQISIESHEAMMRRTATRHHQPHRITLKAKRWLDTKKYVAECYSLNQQVATKRIQGTGRRSPLRFDLLHIRTELAVFLNTHPVRNVSGRAEVL